MELPLLLRARVLDRATTGRIIHRRDISYGPQHSFLRQCEYLPNTGQPHCLSICCYERYIHWSTPASYRIDFHWYISRLDY